MMDEDSEIIDRRYKLTKYISMYRRGDVIPQFKWIEKYGNPTLLISANKYRTWSYEIAFIYISEEEMVVSIVDMEYLNCNNVTIEGENIYNPEIVAYNIINYTSI